MALFAKFRANGGWKELMPALRWNSPKLRRESVMNNNVLYATWEAVEAMCQRPAIKAYNEDGQDREDMLRQIRALVGIINELYGKTNFSYLFDALNSTTRNWSPCAKTERASSIRKTAEKRGIHIDFWEGLLTCYPCARQAKNKNDNLRNFIYDNREALGGCFFYEGKSCLWKNF